MLSALAYTYAMDENILDNELHPLVNIVKTKILGLINERRSEGLSDEKLGELCGFSKTYMHEIRKKLKGDRFTLNAALKIWQGLGHPPETLIADCNVEILAAERIKRIQASDYNRTLILFLEVFSNWEHANPSELAKVEAYLEMIRDRIIAARDQQPADPGGKLSNSTGD